MTAIGIVGASASALAGGQGDPLFGDLNGDGVTDRAVLADGGPGLCDVSVSLGNGSGGFGPPTSYTYAKPGAPVADCPDMGVVVDLGGDGTVELVLAWFNGRPPGVDNDLLVLRDYRPDDGFEAIYQPSEIALADFNGDGRQDVYEWTDQGDGFRTFLNTPGGRLVPGPVRFCSGRPDFTLADFDGDGAMDVLIAYIEGCSGPFMGVVAVLDDGMVVQLQDAELSQGHWSATVVDANSDGIPDARTVNGDTDEVTHFIGHGDGTFAAAPTATDDVVQVRRKRSKLITVLANDAATADATVTIVTGPRYGSVVVTRTRQILYVHARGHLKIDTFSYRLTDDGKTDTATVTVTVTT